MWRDLFAFYLRFRFLLLAVRAWKGRMALRADHHRQRFSASSAVGPAEAAGRLGGWPAWGLAMMGGGGQAFREMRNDPRVKRPRACPARVC